MTDPDLPSGSSADSGVVTVIDRPEVHVPIVIIGAGACGLVAALAARDAGAQVLVLERDTLPRGSTAMSSGLIPAAGTRWQGDHGVSDSPELMADDIQHKNDNGADPAIVELVTERSAATLHWLADRHGVEFSLVTGFLYPGHSALRMHGTSRRTGDELMGALTNAAERAGIDILCEARVDSILVTPSGAMCGVRVVRPDGSSEDIGCDALILACSGFGGHAEMVKRHMPAMAQAVYYGHAGNQGDAIRWAEQLGALTLDLGSYQGHGSLAWPHQTLITWSVMMMGGIQINAYGERFSNEHEGYSEQARRVLSQPGGIAWNVFDHRIHEAAMDFEDYRHACDAGAVIRADSIQDLAKAMNIPEQTLTRTVQSTRALCDGSGTDSMGRRFQPDQSLTAPFYAIRVTGALFHTQGGLAIDREARVMRADGQPISGLYAGGGAARGVSGSADSGYLSGNGLLCAVMLGAAAGESAARRTRRL